MLKVLFGFDDHKLRVFPQIVCGTTLILLAAVCLLGALADHGNII